VVICVGDETVGGGEGGAHEVLVAFWDVQDAAAAGGEEPSVEREGG
jgi:hypothetical protein